jgi:hypothetical protein
MKVTIPMMTKGSNAREHHMQRSRRVKAERSNVAWMLNTCKLGAPPFPCTVTLTRLGPNTKPLDEGDNLPQALKGARDEVAHWLGVDDGSKLVAWKYAQRREKYWAVEIEIEWSAP